MQNGNGRVYPKKILEREMKNKFASKENRALGELDHPDDSVINLKMRHNGYRRLVGREQCYGQRLKFLTVSGKMLQQLVNDGVKLGISNMLLALLMNQTGKQWY